MRELEYQMDKIERMAEQFMSEVHRAREAMNKGEHVQAYRHAVPAGVFAGLLQESLDEFGRKCSVALLDKLEMQRIAYCVEQAEEVRNATEAE